MKLTCLKRTLTNFYLCHTGYDKKLTCLKMAYLNLIDLFKADMFKTDLFKTDFNLFTSDLLKAN